MSATVKAVSVVSVVIPTYHRPQHLSAAVASVLGQQLPAGWNVEVVVAVSDRESGNDIAAATALAEDQRVSVVVADRPGPAAARNAAIRVAVGQLIAFMDDDCIAEAGWLATIIEVMGEGADMVQGSTAPAGPMRQLSHSLRVDPPSWQWETCNLTVSREAIAKGGLFDEDWNPTGRVGDHYGEDLEWGWRLIRGGARPAFAPEAQVLHAVIQRDLVGMVRYDLKVRHFPKILRAVPEVRRHFYLTCFVSRRHAVLTITTGLGLVAAVAVTRGRPRVAGASLALALALWAYPLRPLMIYVPGFVKMLWWLAQADLKELREAPPLPGRGKYLGVFAHRRQAVAVAALGVGIGGLAAAALGRRASATLLGGVAIAAWAAPMRSQRPWLAELGKGLGILAARESAQFFPLLMENVRQRRLLL